MLAPQLCADFNGTNSLPLTTSFHGSSLKCTGSQPSKMMRAASLVTVSPSTFQPSAILSHVFIGELPILCQYSVVYLVFFVSIGSEHDAQDEDFLNAKHITHILNVTNHIPCFFENGRKNIVYKRLPANDSDCQNLKQFFTEASAFIGEYSVFFYRLLFF